MDISTVHASHPPLQCSLEICDFKIETEDSYMIPLLIRMNCGYKFQSRWSWFSHFNVFFSYFLLHLLLAEIFLQNFLKSIAVFVIALIFQPQFCQQSFIYSQAFPSFKLRFHTDFPFFSFFLKRRAIIIAAEACLSLIAFKLINKFYNSV